jgi:uncharacterized protein (DUF427 family)
MEVESVWDYPRPPRVERLSLPVRVELGGEVVADSARALRVLETSHPPVIYVPPADVAPGLRTAVPAGGTRTEPAAAWAYPEPVPGFEALRDHLAFYPSRMDACWIGEARSRAGPGPGAGDTATRARGMRGP